jgi:hypothetical protein
MSFRKTATLVGLGAMTIVALTALGIKATVEQLNTVFENFDFNEDDLK